MADGKPGFSFGVDPEKVITTMEIARWWGWTRQNVERMLRERKIPHHRIGNKVVLTKLRFFENGMFEGDDGGDDGD